MNKQNTRKNTEKIPKKTHLIQLKGTHFDTTAIAIKDIKIRDHFKLNRSSFDTVEIIESFKLLKSRFQQLNSKMKFICSSLLCVLLCSNIILSVSQEFANENGRNKTTFIDLDADVLYLIFEQFDFMDTLNLMEAIPIISPIGVEIFKKRKYEVEINVDASAHPKTTQKNNYVTFSNSSVFLRALKVFGSVIQHLTIKNRQYVKDITPDMNQCINQYTSDSLKLLRIIDVDKDSFTNFTVPFKNLEDLQIVIPSDRYTVVNSAIPLNQMFPKLHRLDITLNGDAKFIDCEFSNLEHVTIQLLYVFYWNPLDGVKNFMKKNPQIKSLHCWRIPTGALQTISEHWPNLVNLSVYIEDIGNNAIHFEHIKHLHLRDNTAYSLNNLTFASLESLRMGYSPRFANEWNEFMEKHIDVKYLHVDLQLSSWTADVVFQLAEQTTKLPNLIEMTISTSIDLQIQNIERMLQSHDKLMKLRIEPMYHWPLGNELLQQPFGNEWYIESFKYGWNNKVVGYLITRTKFSGSNDEH